MKIMLINHYAGSEQYGMEFRPYYMARQWVKSGHEVTVVAASYSHLRKRNPQVKKNFTVEMIDGVRYVWIKTPVYRGNGAGRALNMAAFYFKLKAGLGRLAKQYAPEAVIASSTYPFDFYLADKMAKRTGGRRYFEIHDLWPLTQIELYKMSVNNPYVKLLQRAEDFAFQHADRVISVLPHAYKHMEERGFGAEKFVYIPNGVNLDMPQKPAGQIENVRIIRKLRAQGKFVVLYLGGFALANALEEFVRSAALAGGGVRMVLVGGGPKKSELMELARRTGGAPVFLDAVAKDEVQEVLQAADCLYIGAKRCSLYRYGVGMNKLYDYMLAARPIICGIEASNNTVADVGCGITIPPQDEKAIARAVTELKNLPPAQRERMGKASRDYVTGYHDYRVLAEKFEDAIKEE